MEKVCCLALSLRSVCFGRSFEIELISRNIVGLKEVKCLLLGLMRRL